MRNGYLLPVAALAAAFFTLGTVTTQAQDDIPFAFGTYTQNKDWCKVNRADQKGPDYTEKRAFINLSEHEINWNNSVGKITNVSVEGNKVNLAVEMTTDGKTENRTLPLVRKNTKLFVLAGINFFYCKDYQPNPVLGR